MKAIASLRYLVNDCLWKYFFASNLPPDFFKPNFFDNFGNYTAFNKDIGAVNKDIKSKRKIC